MTIVYDPAPPYPAPAHGGPYPGLVELQSYLIGHYGGTSLGIYVDRPMRGSNSPSLHRDGRALDWRHDDLNVRAEVCTFLIANSEALQIQAIHHYFTSQIWHPITGWHHATGPSFGDPSARWLHIERNYQGARDTRHIGEIVAPVTPPLPTPKKDAPVELWNLPGHSLWLVGAASKAFIVSTADVALLNKGRATPLVTYTVTQAMLDAVTK